MAGKVGSFIVIAVIGLLIVTLLLFSRSARLILAFTAYSILAVISLIIFFPVAGLSLKGRRSGSRVMRQP